MVRFDTSSIIKEFVRKRFEGKCVVCGRTDVVDVAHLYEDANLQIATPDRLILLCPNENQSQQRAHSKSTPPISEILKPGILLEGARSDYRKKSYPQAYGKARLGAYFYENEREYSKAVDCLMEAVSALRPLRWGDWLVATLRETERLCLTQEIGLHKRWLLLDRFALVLFDYARWDEAIDLLSAAIALKKALSSTDYDPQQFKFDEQAAFKRETMIRSGTSKFESGQNVPDFLQQLEEQATELLKSQKHDAAFTTLDVARAISRWNGQEERAHQYSEAALDFRAKISHSWAFLEHLVSEAEYFASRHDHNRSRYYASEAMSLFSEHPAVLEPVLDGEPTPLSIHQRLERLGITVQDLSAAGVSIRPSLVEGPLALDKAEITRVARAIFENPGRPSK